MIVRPPGRGHTIGSSTAQGRRPSRWAIDHNQRMNQLAAACEDRDAHVGDEPEGGRVVCADCEVRWSGPAAGQWRCPTAADVAPAQVSASCALSSASTCPRWMQRRTPPTGRCPPPRRQLYATGVTARYVASHDAVFSAQPGTLTILSTGGGRPAQASSSAPPRFGTSPDLAAAEPPPSESRSWCRPECPSAERSVSQRSRAPQQCHSPDAAGSVPRRRAAGRARTLSPESPRPRIPARVS